MKQTLYKLTDSEGYTRRGESNETLWTAGIVVETKVEGIQLCTNQVIHAYTDPLLALLLNPIHANIVDPLLWECEGEVVATDNGLKVGVKSLTCIKQLEIPAVTDEHRVRFAILCSLEVCKDANYVKWATAWLDGTDRSEAAAWAAARAAAEARAAWEAAWTAAWTAAWAAARAAAEARAAWEAAWTAAWAAKTNTSIDLIAIAHKACV